MFLSLLFTACVPSSGRGVGDGGEGFGLDLTSIEELTLVDLAADEKLTVVATTSIVADVVAAIGGKFIELTTLMPTGIDPHAFEPVPSDLQAIARADVVFLNGLGLEAFLGELFASAGGNAFLVSISEGVTPLVLYADDASGADDRDEKDEADKHTVDAHVWFDPTKVKVWVANASKALSKLDPSHASQFEANATGYIRRLEELDAWIQDQVSVVPESDRKIVTDHLVFGYFADRYGFQIVGALLPVFSTSAEASAAEIAALEDEIRSQQVKVIFVGMDSPAALAARVKDDTGIRLVRLYTGSLSEPEGPAGSYIDFMRYNVGEIMNGLVE
jgi:ABC-type Zn uptake system ZnuABC Zn-binding protein ZnuA